MAKLKPNQFILDGHLVTERPILFQTDMVRAILEDRKTQTRRTNSLNSINVDAEFWNRKNNPKLHVSRLWDSTKEVNPNPIKVKFGFIDPLGSKEYIECPYGKKGDLLWVREKFRIGGHTTHYYEYFADRDDWMDSKLIKWKPSIHMPKEAARIWLMIVDIGLERLHDISEEDALKEGVKFFHNPLFKEFRFKDYINPESEWRNAKSSFESLWISINGKESWKSNPWVWVIKFKVLSKTGRPSNELIQSEIINLKSKISRKEVSNA